MKELLEKDRLLTGNDIYFIRTALNMTQKSFSEHIGVHLATIYQWEENQNDLIQARLPIQTLIKLIYADHLIDDDKKFRKLLKNLLPIFVF